MIKCINQRMLTEIAEQQLQMETGSSSAYYNSTVQLHKNEAPNSKSLPTYVKHMNNATRMQDLSSRTFSEMIDETPLGQEGYANESITEMITDEPRSLSPDSFSSSSREDEEFATAILHAIECGSFSPRNYQLGELVNPHLQKQRKIATSNAHATARKKRLPTVSSHSRESVALSWNDAFAQPSNYARSTFHGQEGAPSGRRTTTSMSSAPSYHLEGSLSSHRRGKPLDNVTLPMPIPNSENRYNFPVGTSSMSTPETLPTASSSSSSKKHRRTPRARPENHQCPNCHTLDSPLWRNCMIRGKLLHLCNSCGLRYKKHKYCPYCYVVYYDAETNTHDWCQCVICHNWTHRQCIINAGASKSINLDSYRCINCFQQSDFE
ncbi:uncharacterized protein LOC126326053 isoform X2 [Schistocerca gregaria]|uniref:uncharacterized protein LOC126326053 isoform X2 n=1 Tax=Schistocerca gregaria TaxID=7010 RepID=UPI00211E383F|nr:uncharacterized protein LOC126326053 isoform X2 [Schistocerca gregaria]